MREVRKISRDPTHYRVSIPKAWAASHGIAPGSRLPVLAETAGRLEILSVPVVAHARGLYLTIPYRFRADHGLTHGSPVWLLLEEGPTVTLQPVEGASLKELERLGLTEPLDRLQQMARRLADVRQAGYAEGLFTGHAQGYVQGLRSRQERARSPEEPEP